MSRFSSFSYNNAASGAQGRELSQTDLEKVDGGIEFQGLDTTPGAHLNQFGSYNPNMVGDATLHGLTGGGLLGSLVHDFGHSGAPFGTATGGAGGTGAHGTGNGGYPGGTGVNGDPTHPGGINGFNGVHLSGITGLVGDTSHGPNGVNGGGPLGGPNGVGGNPLGGGPAGGFAGNPLNPNSPLGGLGGPDSPYGPGGTGAGLPAALSAIANGGHLPWGASAYLPGGAAGAGHQIAQTQSFHISSTGDPHENVEINGQSIAQIDTTDGIHNFQTFNNTIGGATTISTQTAQAGGAWYNGEIDFSARTWAMEVTANGTTLHDARGTFQLQEGQTVTEQDGTVIANQGGHLSVTQQLNDGGHVTTDITDQGTYLDMDTKGVGNAMLSGWSADKFMEQHPQAQGVLPQGVAVQGNGFPV
jgi:hypothetical protein